MNENVVKEFYCEQCGMLFEGSMKFDNQSDFDYHLSLHKKVEETKESANLCHIEPQVKIINTSLELSVFDGSAIVKCNSCGKRFLNKKYLSLHVRSVHEPQKIEPEKTEPEKTEPEKSEPEKTETERTETQKIEPPAKRIKTSLELCGSDASSKCNFCGKNFSYKGTLSLHVQSVHENCNTCGKSFSNKGTLSMHVRSVHERKNIEIMKESSNLCPTELQKIEPQVKIINTSLKHGVSDASLNCNTCGKTFSNKDNLSSHVRSAHEGKKSHKCYACGVHYLLKDTLLIHFKHTLHDKMSINCKFCDRKFTQKDMEIHIAIFHEGKEPYM